MSSNNQAAILRSDSGTAVPLRGVAATGTLNGLLFELAVEQRWENTGQHNIEAVYSFPVPHRATLLGLDLRIGGRHLSGVALAKRQASARYEEAVEAGNTAALLEQAGDGLYTVSLGNLLAGETAVIRYRYAELLDRHQDTVRLCVPTVIAPRYGDAGEAGLAPHQQPSTDLLADYPFDLSIRVLGEQARAAFSSPSHPVQVMDIDGGKQIVLGPGARLDRDFILQLRGAVTAAASVTAPDPRATSASDDQPACVSLVSLNPCPEAAALRNLSLKLLVDCSGSMGGDSIQQARHALRAVLDRLTPADAVSLTRFGSSVDHQVPAGAGVLLQPATPALQAFLKDAVAEMDADLGGTNLPEALEATIAIPSCRNPATGVQDLLLVTDGEVWAMDPALNAVARSGHRLFVIAVGAAPNEALARNIADKTGGACECVSPNEDIEGAILRMFHRLREAPKRITAVDWPQKPDWQAPLPAMVFSGDTLHLIAGFSTPPTGDVRVTITDSDGEIRQLRWPLTAPAVVDALPRLAAGRRLVAMDEDQAATVAERYQLATRHTSFLVVQVRADREQAQAMPELRQVAQMLAAGWGATGSVHSEPAAPGMAMLQRESFMPTANFCLDVMDEAPGFIRRSVPGRVSGPPRSVEARNLVSAFDPDDSPDISPSELLAGLVALLAAGGNLPDSVAELTELGLPVRVGRRLNRVVTGSDTSEAELVQLFIALLAASPAGDGLTPDQRSALTGDLLGRRELRDARQALKKLVARITADAWAAPRSTVLQP